MKRLGPVLLCAFIILGNATTSHSYILPAEQILGFMIKQLGSARTLQIFQQTVIYDPSVEEGMREFDATLYYRYPDRFRYEVHTPEGEHVCVIGPEGAIFVTNGEIVGERESPFDDFKDLLLYRQTGLLKKELSRVGVNLEVVSLGRYTDKICYVIGAKYPDESLPQVWIEKNTFRPIRYILIPGSPTDSDSEEVEYADYMSLGKDNWYPARILFYKNGRLAKMYVLKTFKINPELPPELFDIAYLKTISQPMVSSHPAPSLPSEFDEVEKTIKDFKKTFE
jgi:outer membrane lipoprotein-sorting protein